MYICFHIIIREYHHIIFSQSTLLVLLLTMHHNHNDNTICKAIVKMALQEAINRIFIKIYFKYFLTCLYYGRYILTYNQTHIYNSISLKPSKCPASRQAMSKGLKFLTRPLRNLHREDLRAIRTKFTPWNGSEVFHPSQGVYYRQIWFSRDVANAIPSASNFPRRWNIYGMTRIQSRALFWRSEINSGENFYISRVVIPFLECK